MLATLRDFLQRLGAEDEDEHFAPDDARLAVAALLVRSIAIDGVVSETERVKLRELLARKYELHGDDLDALIADATEAEHEAVDLYRFTSLLKNRLSKEERIAVIGDLWEIAYADGQSDEFEENLVWRVAELLAVNSRDRIAAKQRVLKNRSADGGEGA
jgi:uncharacterized tellurite resistance protein B-like protein